MPQYSIPYGFSQHFDVPAKDAYKWCTSYETEDLVTMGENGKRKIRWLSEDTVILTDAFHGKNGRSITKRKLVRLYHDGLFWTNTHISGPNKYSQFLYQVVPEGRKTSRLDFTGLQIEYGDKPAQRKITSLAKILVVEDGGAWKLLARAMEKDLLGTRRS